MTIDVADVTADRLADLETRFGFDEVADGHWCMWFIIRVKDLHARRSPVRRRPTNGREPLFAASGFEPVRRLYDNRVVMHRTPGQDDRARRGALPRASIPR